MTGAKSATFCLMLAMAFVGGTFGAAAGCRQAGGLAEMPTRGIAEFMAEAALKNAIANHGWKAAGPIKMTCKDNAITTTCTARRRACD